MKWATTVFIFLASGEVCGSFSNAGCNNVQKDSKKTEESSINSFYEKSIGVVSMDKWNDQTLEKNSPVR